jgi:hypothetical protein
MNFVENIKNNNDNNNKIFIQIASYRAVGVGIGQIV